MRQFIVSAFSGDGFLWLYLNEKLVLRNSQSVTLEIENGEHVVQWYVEGPSGGSYSITISSPAQAQFHIARVVGQGGKSFGGFQFKN
jgi:hypothetical protein